MWPEWILNDLLVIYYLRSYTYNPLQVALSMKSKVNRYVSHYDADILTSETTGPERSTMIPQL